MKIILLRQVKEGSTFMIDSWPAYKFLNCNTHHFHLLFATQHHQCNLGHISVVLQQCEQSLWGHFHRQLGGKYHKQLGVECQKQLGRQG